MLGIDGELVEYQMMRGANFGNPKGCWGVLERIEDVLRLCGVVGGCFGLVPKGWGVTELEL